jgi:hypothetical protein
MSNNKDLENAFIFLKCFTHPSNVNIDKIIDADFLYSPWHYRKYIIQTIREKYTAEEFYKYELILNSLYWKMKNKLAPYVTDITKFIITEEVKVEDIYSQSNINSKYQYNEKMKKYFILEKIGKLDKICISIIKNKSIYKKYLSGVNIQKIVDNIKLNTDDYYYFDNYAFPNLNPMFKNLNSKKRWMNKINRMYYNPIDKDNTIDDYWYKLIN